MKDILVLRMDHIPPKIIVVIEYYKISSRARFPLRDYLPVSHQVN